MVSPEKAYFTDHTMMQCCSCSMGLSEAGGRRTMRKTAQGLAEHGGTCLKLDLSLMQDFSDFRFPPFPAPKLTRGQKEAEQKQFKSKKGDMILNWKGQEGT